MAENTLPTPSQHAGDEWFTELQWLIKDLQNETILWTLPALVGLGLILLASGADVIDPIKGLFSAFLLFLLAAIVAYLRNRSYRVAAWTLVIGCLVANLLVIVWGGFTPAVFLLALPVGLALLTTSRVGGLVTAIVCSVILILAPTIYLPGVQAARTLAILGIWGTVGIMLLTLRPLLTAGWWVWSSYQRSTVLLENARDTQVQLYEALEDLESTNKQLARLNQQAQMLREIAENERQVKEQFVANISHELRTPLHMIIGFCEVITQKPETYGWGIPETLLADLAVVLRNGQHLSSLIDDVLDLSQIDARQMALTRERVSLVEIIENAVVAVRPLFAAKQLTLTIDAQDELAMVLCDRTRIREVVLNLLSNAGRFTEEGGVHIHLWQEADDVIVSIADTGPGIAEQNLGRLFKPFQQVDGSIRRRYGGTGLGLTISQKFVELHEGKMWVESELDRGTTFFFRLPIDPPLPIKADASRWLNPHQPYVERYRSVRYRPEPADPRLLVVETGASMQRLLTRYMDGVEIAAVKNLEDAVADLAITPAQALLVNDHDMGDALKRINQTEGIPPDVPVIICSISDPQQTAKALGAADYLLKPVSSEALRHALMKLGRPIRKVLVADDEPEAAQMFQRILMSPDHGSDHMDTPDYRVRTALDGQRTLALMHKFKPDVVLLDLTMPNIDGFGVLTAKAQDPILRDIPVILVTARDPQGQSILSKSLALTYGRGLSVYQLLESIKALRAILEDTRPSADPALTRVPSG